MSSRHTKKSSLIIREMKIKITMRYHLIQVRMDIIKKSTNGNFLGVQWLGLGAVTAEGLRSVPGREIKIRQAVRQGQEKNLQITNAGERVERGNTYTLLVGMSVGAITVENSTECP